MKEPEIHDPVTVNLIAHIVTATPNLLQGLIIHPYSKETVRMFLADTEKLRLS